MKSRKEERETKLRRMIIISSAVVLSLVVIYLLKLNFGNYFTEVFKAFSAVITPAAIALFVMYLIDPLYQMLYKKAHLKKGVSALISIVAFFIILIAFLALIGFLIISQLSAIIPMIEENWPLILEKMNSIRNIIPGDILLQIINSSGDIDLTKVISFITSEIGNVDIFNNILEITITSISTIIYGLIMIVMFPVFLFFFLTQGERIFSGIIKVIPKKFYKDDIEVMAKLANSSTEKYMRGKLISIFFLFLFFSFGFAIAFIVLGEMSIMSAILYGLLFGAIIAILDLIPYIGPLIGAVLPIFFIFVVATTTIQFFIFAGILIAIDALGQTLQKILIEPIIMSKEVDIHPLAVFVGLLFFGSLFGFAGFIIATPVVATIRSVYNYLMGKYSEEQIEAIINEDVIKPDDGKDLLIEIKNEIKETLNIEED